MTMTRYWAAVLDYERSQLAYELKHPRRQYSNAAVREIRIEIAQRGLMKSQQKELWAELQQEQQHD